MSCESSRASGLDAVRVSANGISFSVLAAGPADGPLVVFLHGFPQLASAWERQLEALGAAGYRAAAPDMRGYGETERRGPYDLRTLARDVAELVRGLGARRATIVGHDWGGAAAWMAAHWEPEVVERLIVLNAPHPATMGSELLRNPRQLVRSSYIAFFLLPWLPERILTSGRGAPVAWGIRLATRVPSAWTPRELDRYRTAFVEAGAARAALAYYRAALRR